MNTKQNNFDPYNNTNLIYSKKENFNKIFRKKDNLEPVLQELYLKKNEDSKVFIVKEIATNEIIAGKFFTEFYKKVQTFSTFENAKLFLSDIEKNFFYSQFFFDAISLFKKNIHPLQKSFIPPIYINDVSKKIYKGINYFNIAHKNIQNKNEETVFLSNHIINLNRFEYKNKDCLISIMENFDENENEAKYDMIAARNNLKTLGNKKYKFINESNSAELEVLENDENYIKLYKTINNFFFSAANQKMYEPNNFVLSNGFLNYIKENPSLFIEAVKMLGTEVFHDLKIEETIDE